MLLLALFSSTRAISYFMPWCACQSYSESWGHSSCLPSLCTSFGWRLGAGGPSAPSSISCWSWSWCCFWPSYLRPSHLLLGALVRLPKLVPGAGASAAACPPCAHPLAGLLVQEFPLRLPKSVAEAVADAATGPPYLRPSNLLLYALVRLPKVVPGAGARAAACPPCEHHSAGVLVQGAPLRHPKSVAGAGADAASGLPYLRPSNLLLRALMRLPKLVPEAAPSAYACPLCAHLLAGVLVHGAQPCQP